MTRDAAHWAPNFTGDPSTDVPLFPPSPHLLELVDTLPVGTALDIGCGPGALAVEMATRGWTVRGVDPSPEAIDSAKAHAAASGVEAAFEIGRPAYWIPLGVYDLVTSAHALTVPDHEARRAAAVVAAPVKPEGWLAITEWAPDAASDLGFGSSDLISAADIIAELPGFEIVRNDTVRSPRHDGQGDADAVIIVAHRHPR